MTCALLHWVDEWGSFRVTVPSTLPRLRVLGHLDLPGASLSPGLLSRVKRIWHAGV